MSDSTLWWIASGLAIAVELFSGTFYLLMAALGMAAAALAAHAGLGLTGQLLVAALVGGASIFTLYRRRRRQPRSLRATANKDVNLDIGETVEVLQWDATHHTTVRYRGADWQASLAPGAQTAASDSPAPGTYRITEVLGSRLILHPV